MSPPRSLWAAHASLDACSKASGARMHDVRGVGDGAVQSHLQRVAAPCGGDGAPHFAREQEGIFFGGNHVRKGTFFFGSPLHAARVASAKTA